MNKNQVNPSPYILTLTGRHFNFAQPDPASVELETIAHGLAYINRFCGQAFYGYSVAQHSVAVSWYLERCGEPREVQFAGLMHDAHEAYFGDITAPLKAFLKIGHLETPIQKAVGARFGLTLAQLKDWRVKLADLTALAVEAENLLPPDSEEWPVLAPVSREMMQVMTLPRELTPREAKALFLARFDELTSSLY